MLVVTDTLTSVFFIRTMVVEMIALFFAGTTPPFSAHAQKVKADFSKKKGNCTYYRNFNTNHCRN